MGGGWESVKEDGSLKNGVLVGNISNNVKLPMEEPGDWSHGVIENGVKSATDPIWTKSSEFDKYTRSSSLL